MKLPPSLRIAFPRPQAALNDVFGGLSSAIVALPLALAFGVSSGLGAAAGLYGAIAVGLGAALFGGTRGLISSPTGPMTVVSAIIIAESFSVNESRSEALGEIVLIFVLAGAFQAALGLLRFGKYIKYIPYPVVSGFMSGIGLIIILMQGRNFFGLEAGPIDWASLPSQLNASAVGLATMTLLTVYLLPRLTKAVPSSLVALVLGTATAYFLGMDVARIGAIPSGLPSLALPGWHGGSLRFVLSSAVQLGALGILDTLLTAVVADNITKTRHDGNRELLGQGVANALAGLAGGLPGAGTTTCTVINIKSGGRGRLAGIANALILMTVLLGAGPLASQIPLAVLAGLLVAVGVDIIDYEGIRYMRIMPRGDTATALTVFVLTVFVDLLVAVGVGVVLSLALFMKAMSDQINHDSRLERLREHLRERGLPEEGYDAATLDGTVVKSIEGPLFFGHAPDFQRKLGQLRDLDTLVINMSHVPSIDEAGLYAFKESIEALHQHGVKVLVADIQKQPFTMIKLMRLFPTVLHGNEYFPDLESCLESLKVERERAKATA